MRTNDRNISCRVEFKLLVGRLIANIMVMMSRIHILYFPYRVINTSPCDYSGISKPVEKVSCNYVLSGLRQASITRTPLLSFTFTWEATMLFLFCNFRKPPPTSLFYSQALGVSLDCVADHISPCKYPVTKTSYWDHSVFPLPPRRLHYNTLSMGFLITSRDLMFIWYVLHKINYDNLIL